MLFTLIVGGIIGVIAGMITGEKRGCLFNIVAGLIGSYIGQRLFGNWGPEISDTRIVPAVLGAIIFTAVISFVFGSQKK